MSDPDGKFFNYSIKYFMKLFDPQVQLFHSLTATGPRIYYLHAVTFTDQTNFQPTGFLVRSTEPDADNTVTVELFVERSDEIPDIHSLNPIVHTLEIGSIPFNGEGFFSILVIDRSPSGSRSMEEGETKGDAKVSNTSSKGKDRPTKDELVVPHLFTT